MESWLFAMIPVLFLGIGALFLFIAIKQFKDARIQQTWSSTTATIRAADPGIGYRSMEDRRGVSLSGSGISLNLSGKNSGCWPKITYDYSVGGSAYSGDRYGNVPPDGYSEYQANQIVAEYPPGKTVPVFYDPANPASSVLRQQKAGCAAYFMIAIAGLITTVGLIITLGAIYFTFISK